MSVTYRPDKPNETEELKKEVETVKAAGESTAALLSLSFKAQIVADRAAGTNAITDEMILASTDIVEYRKVKTAKRAPRGKSIEKRPAEVEGREVFGHWEMDTVYSGKQTSKKALLVLTERKTRKEIIERMPDRTEESTIKALDRIERRFGAIFRKVFKTITVDNGGEFSNVERLEQSAIRKGKRTSFFYCHPYSSFERGSNENQNRMIRRRYPKGTDFGKVSTAEIKNLEQWINNYPREILGWKTSEMCFRECLDAL